MRYEADFTAVAYFSNLSDPDVRLAEIPRKSSYYHPDMELLCVSCNGQVCVALKRARSFPKNPEKKEYSRDLGIDEGTIVRRVLRKCAAMVGIKFSLLRIGCCGRTF
jgi:hypothetical protein